MVTRQGLVLAGAGVAVGLVGAAVVTRFLAALLYGVTPGDPATLGGAALTLLGAAAFASWVPARRAARVDPTTALRSD
jgi:ABC-type antimicrobial peptide transport system permease subunit